MRDASVLIRDNQIHLNYRLSISGELRDPRVYFLKLDWPVFPLSAMLLQHRLHSGFNMDTKIKIEHIEISTINPHPDNPRLHSKKQIRQIAQSIEAFGFRMPVIIDQDSRLICGHARVEASKLLKLSEIPAVRVTDLDDAQIRGLMIADNQLTVISTWDDQLLGEHLKVLSDLDLDFDIECLGFDYGEIEQRVLSIESFNELVEEDGSDDQPELNTMPTVTQLSDL